MLAASWGVTRDLYRSKQLAGNWWTVLRLWVIFFPNFIASVARFA
jgi:hypothetical protein